MLNSNPDELAEAFAEYVPTEEEPKEPTPEVEEETVEEEADPTELEDEESEDEEVEDVEDDTEEEDAPRTLEVNGELIPEDEVIAGYMKDADYRRKTAETATIRKEVEADRERYGKGIETLVAQLAVADQLIRESGLNLTDEQLDELAANNPAEFVRMQRLMNKQTEKANVLMQQWQQAEQARAEERKQAVEKHRKTEREALVQEYPEFRKDETWERLYGFLGEKFNFSKEELDTITDRRFAVIAEKARRYENLMAKGKAKQVKAQGKVIKAGAAKPTQQADTQQSFQRGIAQVKKGNREALGDLLLNNL